MKCPKCGYNSFDYLDSCKKCGKNLVEFKQRYGIKSILFTGVAGIAAATANEEDLLAVEAPELAAAAAMGATATAVRSDNREADDGAEADDFGFDFMGESSEEEDLSFDELFEEAPEEEDMEESLEAPRSGSTDEKKAAADSDFSFDVPEADEELEDDFGVDVGEEVNRTEKTRGSAEGPSDPFDLPESSPGVGAPDTVENVGTVEAASVIVAATAAVPAAEGRTGPFATSSPSTEEENESVVEAGETVAEAIVPTAVETFDDEVAGSYPPDVVPASIGGRFASFVYDGVILALVGLSFLVAAEMSMSRKSGFLPTLDTLIDMSVPYFLILFAVAFGYFTLFHFLAGQTPGKMLTSLRVETIDGEPLSFSQAFLRSVGGLLQLVPFGLGYLLILFSGDGRGWNDRLAGTRVVLAPEIK